MRQFFLAMLAATGLAVLGTTVHAQQVLVSPTTTVQYTPYYYGSTSYYGPYSTYSPGVTYYSTPYANSYYYPGYTSSYVRRIRTTRTRTITATTRLATISLSGRGGGRR